MTQPPGSEDPIEVPGNIILNDTLQDGQARLNAAMTIPILHDKSEEADVAFNRELNLLTLMFRRGLQVVGNRQAVVDLLHWLEVREVEYPPEVVSILLIYALMRIVEWEDGEVADMKSNGASGTQQEQDS